MAIICYARYLIQSKPEYSTICRVAVNADYANRIAEISDSVERAKFVDDKRREYEMDVELSRLASVLIIDVDVASEAVLGELTWRLAQPDLVDREGVAKRHGVYPG